MKTRLWCSIMLLVSVSCFATTYTWTNASGDPNHAFTQFSNWTPAVPAAGFTIADEFRIDLSGDQYSEIFEDTIGGKVFSGYGSGKTGELYVTGGVSDFESNFMAGRGATSIGYLFVNGGEITFLKSYFTIGESGTGNFNISNGTVKTNRFNMANKAGSKANVAISGGLVDISTSLKCGMTGTASLVMSGGQIKTGSFMLVGENLGSSGTVELSGGRIDITELLTIGNSGQAFLSIDGSAGQIQCGQLAINEQSIIQLNIDGTAIFGNPITVTTSDSTLPGNFDPNFTSGTERGGSYVAVAALQNKILTSEPNVSTTAFAAGWTSQTVNIGAGQAVLLIHPHYGNNVSWTGASSQLWSNAANWSTSLDSNDAAVIDLAGTSGAILNSTAACSGLVVGSASTGSLNVNAGANAAFGSLIVADTNASSGSLTVSDGTMNVSSTAFIGSSGKASFTMNGGAFYAGNLIAAFNPDSTADILISNNAVVDIDGITGLGANAKLSLSGHQATAEFGSLTAAEGSEINFVLDGALGVGNGLVVNGDVVLNGAINIGFIDNAAVDTTYTVLRSTGKIDDNTDGKLVKGAFVTYALVQDGDYHTLQVTVFSPENCQEVIDGGMGLSADINQDCRVNIADFAELASQWLLCNDPQQCD